MTAITNSPGARPKDAAKTDPEGTARGKTDLAAAQLAAIVTSSDDAIVGKDLSGIVTSWNAAAERIFGYRADEMIDQPITRIIPKERLGEEDAILRKIVVGETVSHFDTVRLRKDGSRIPVSVTVSAIRDRDGVIMGASKIARDITEREIAESTIRQLNATTGLTVLLVEQNANLALRLAHRGYVLVNGRITMEGTGRELLARPEIRDAYLGESHAA